MERLFTFSATLIDDETITRELKSETKERAFRLMKTKFPDAISIELLSEREITVEDQVEVEYARIESTLQDLEDSERRQRQLKASGIALIGAGVIATIALFFYGWISWLTFAPIGVGTFAYLNGSWGEKRAKRLKAWEMESIER